MPFCPTFLVDVKQGQTADDDNVEANGGGASWADKIPSVILESFIWLHKLTDKNYASQHKHLSAFAALAIAMYNNNNKLPREYTYRG